MAKYIAALFLMSLYFAPYASAAGLDCSIGGGVYAENVQVSGYPVWCSAGDKFNASTTSSPYCFVRTQTDCEAIVNGGYYVPSYNYQQYFYTQCVPSGYCSAQPVCGTSAVGVDNCGFPCSRSAAACPVQPNTATVDQNVSNTNINTNTSTSTSNASAVSHGSTVNITQTTTREIVREIPVTREIIREVPAVVRVEQPKVIQVSGDSQVKELPKTGPAATGLLLSSLIPLGLVIRNKYGASIKEKITPNLLWRNRFIRKN